MLERMSDMTCQIITNEHGNVEYMNEEIPKMPQKKRGYIP